MTTTVETTMPENTSTSEATTEATKKRSRRRGRRLSTFERAHRKATNAQVLAFINRARTAAGLTALDELPRGRWYKTMWDNNITRACTTDADSVYTPQATPVFELTDGQGTLARAGLLIHFPARTPDSADATVLVQLPPSLEIYDLSRGELFAWMYQDREAGLLAMVNHARSLIGLPPLATLPGRFYRDPWHNTVTAAIEDGIPQAYPTGARPSVELDAIRGVVIHTDDAELVVAHTPISQAQTTQLRADTTSPTEQARTPRRRRGTRGGKRVQERRAQAAARTASTTPGLAPKDATGINAGTWKDDRGNPRVARAGLVLSA